MSRLYEMTRIPAKIKSVDTMTEAEFNAELESGKITATIDNPDGNPKYNLYELFHPLLDKQVNIVC